MESVRKMPKAASVDEYINRYPAKVQSVLKKIRSTIKKTAPKAEEMISYGIPGYKYHGVLIYFAAWEKHVSIYPAPRGNDAFKKELSAYKGGKGTIQFPLDEPIPFELVASITHFRMKENEEKAAAKKTKKKT